MSDDAYVSYFYAVIHDKFIHVENLHNGIILLDSKVLIYSRWLMENSERGKKTSRHSNYSMASGTINKKKLYMQNFLRIFLYTESKREEATQTARRH